MRRLVTRGGHVMKRVVIILALVVLAAPAEAATWYVRSGRPNTTGPANSCAPGDVLAAHNAAANNPSAPDTIQLASCNVTWTTALTFTKSLIVKGAGVNNTIIAYAIVSGQSAITWGVPAGGVA